MFKASDDFDRIYATAWSSNATPANSALFYPNKDDTRFIALGGQDTTGVVRIIPQVGNALVGQYFDVAADVPFVGLLKGPFLIQPVISSQGFADQTLDLFIHRCQPNVPVRRSPMLSYAGNIANQAIPYSVWGRKRIRFAFSSAASSAVVNVLVLQPSSNSTATSQVVFTATLASGATAIYEMNAVQGSTTSGLTGAYNVAVQETANKSCQASIEAWD